MLKYLLGIVFLITYQYKSYSQQDNDTSVLFVDSIVYEIDTVKGTETLSNYIYNAPENYNLVGYYFGLNVLEIKGENHTSSSNSFSNELFVKYSRKKHLLTTGINFMKCTENVSYSIIHKQYKDTSFEITDTVTSYKIILHSGDTLVKYVTRQIPTTRTDTITNTETIKNSATIKCISVPIHYGYYVKEGYYRINIGCTFIPQVLQIENPTNDIYLLPTGTQFCFQIEPTIEASYWLLDKIFLHSAVSFRKNMSKIENINKNKIQISSFLIKFGISCLFFDKKRE